MLGPKITDPKERERFEAELAEERRQAIAQGAAFEDPELDTILTEIEQEPGYWEEMAEFAERHWPSKKPQAEQSDATAGETAEAPPEA